VPLLVLNAPNRVAWLIAFAAFRGLASEGDHGHAPAKHPAHGPHEAHKAHEAQARTEAKTEAKSKQKTEPKTQESHAETGSARGTRVCGTLRLAEEWTAQGSPYLITGDVFVPVTSRLRIEPGVEIRFTSKPSPCEGEAGAKPTAKSKPGGHTSEHSAAHSAEHSGEHQADHAAKPAAPAEREPNTPPPLRDFSDSTYTTLTIEGAFYCIGSPQKPVRFLPADTTKGAPPWDGVRLSGQREGRAEIAFAEFSGANVGLYVEKADLYIHHSVFDNNNTGLWCGRHANVTPMFNLFTRNRSAGLYIEKAVPHVVNNIFWQNRGYGIWSDGSKSMIIEYNAFHGNGEDDCYRCAHDVMPLGEGGIGDTLDTYGNRRTDPVFIDSDSFKALRLKDPRYDTPSHLVKDTALAAAEKKSRWRWFKKSDEAKPFAPRGQGPWRLSEYSPLRNAGHPARTLRNVDGTRSDLGIWGGPQERITKSPFLGM
jgi:Right handed beta helix region